MSELEDLATIYDRADSRLRAMVAHDPQLMAPIEDVIAASRRPGLSYPEVIAEILAGYAERPAIGVRDYRIIRDGSTGRTKRQILPRFKTLSYGDLASRIEAIANCWRHIPHLRVVPGECVLFLAFSGPEMAAIDLACAYAQAVAVPVQANMAQADVQNILRDIAPVTLVASIENLAMAATYASGHPSVRNLIAIDIDPGVDEERDIFEAVKAQLAAEGKGPVLSTFGEMIAEGQGHSWTPLPRPQSGADHLTMIMYTSGSSGTPKGAMIHDAICTQFWMPARCRPTITMAYAPMNHFMGRSTIYTTLAQGGTAFLTQKSDMSALLEDIRLARPTFISFIPRLCDLVYQQYQADVQRLVCEGVDPGEADRQVRVAMGRTFLGDRLVLGIVGSAPTAPEVRSFIRDCFDMALVETYGSTEGGGSALLAGYHIVPGLVLDYKLRDVPELGYYNSDRPCPRGELLVKSRLAIKGYYKQPEASAAIFDDDGYLLTGDIMEQRGAGHLVWLDRRNNVIKLSQAEFVAIGPLEATFLGQSPLIRQIFVYGSSLRSFLLAVVVPDLDVARAQLGREAIAADLHKMILVELQRVARETGLKSFETPRDVIIELEPFSLENGLLSSVRKPLRPNLLARYGEDLETLYREMDLQQQQHLARLRNDASDLTTLDRVIGALEANLGLGSLGADDVGSYSDLGGDSFGAISLSLLIEEMFGVAPPVGLILSPTATPRRIADYIDGALASGQADARPGFAEIHGPDPVTVRARDLRLERFLDKDAMLAAAMAASPAPESRTVLLTGANGYLGRFLCLEWLERLAQANGKLICLIRANDPKMARARLDEAIGTADPALTGRFRDLAASHLEVVPGDLSAPRLGLSEPDFIRLAGEVDHIVHPAALVNHMLSYRNLFEPNVVGTAELIRLALAGRQKRFDHISSIAVPNLNASFAAAREDADVRTEASDIILTGGYGQGYALSKWAGEVLLRDAHELFGLPVNIFRADMILAHSRFAGQINPSDLFTRLLFSIVATGLAPGSFYAREPGKERPLAHYDGLPADFIAAAVQQLGERRHRGFETCNIVNSNDDDGVSLDRIVDWIASSGTAIRYVEDHAEWLRQFEDRLRHLPLDKRQQSSLAILDFFAKPHNPRPNLIRSEAFLSALQGISAGPDIPHLDERFIHKCLDDIALIQNAV